MEDIRIKITAESEVKNAQNDLSELLKANNELIKSINSLREAMDAKANQSKRNTEEEIGLINKLKASIQTLTDARNKSLNTSEIESYNKKIQQQTAELQKLTTVQQQSTVLTKEQNAQIQSLTGNAEKSNGMFKNLALTLGAMFAADRIIDYTKSLFDATIQAERQNIALKNISATNEEYANSIGFLNEITNKYGQNINSVRESYVGFIAASKSSNLALGERQKIYESVIQAGSTLQLSNEKIERSLNAVSQMFSKGNVSAEELRQQLGESLPGAFGIMAKALNVNEKQLNKMLEQGEVLAKDALPKFGAALTELYGDKAQSNVNTWAGGLNRATNAIIAWSQKTNESIGLTRKMADAANWLADNLDSVINAILAMSAAIAVNTLRTIANNTVKQIQLVMLGREVLAKQAASAVTLELTAAETAAAAAATRFNTAMAAAPWGAALLAITAVVGILLEYNDAQQRAYELTEAGIKATDETIKQERMHSIELGNSIEQTKKLAYGTEERLTNVKKLMQQYPQYFKDMTAEQVSNWHLTNAYRGVNAEIERKITLLAREKAVEKQTDRLVDIKLELESMGVYVKTLKEFNLEEQKRGLHINLNGPKIHALLKEQDNLSKTLISTSEKLSESQKQMFNQEARNNKAKLEAGVISEKEFKAEVMRIQSVYGIKVQNYKIEETLITGNVDSKKKGNKEKANDEQKHLEFIKKLKEDSAEKIKKIDEDYTKWLFDEHEKRSKIQTKAIEQIQKNIEKSIKDRVDSHENLEERTKKFFDKIGKEINDLHEKNQDKQLKKNKETAEDIIKSEKEKADRIKQIQQDVVSYGLSFLSDLVSKQASVIDDQLNNATTNLEKAILNNQKAWLGVADSAIGSIDQLAQGNFVGAIVGGLTTVFKAIDTAADKSYELEMARIEDLRIAAEKFGQELLSTSAKLISAEDITEFKNLYNSVHQEIVATWKSEDVASLFGFEQAIQNEKEVAASINRNFEVAKTREEELYQQKIKSINDSYNLEVEKINAKYDLLSTKNSQRFDAESLGIQKGVNEDLMAFVTNQDLKLGLISQYNGKRAEIESRFALSYKPIVEGMSQAEIDGINASIKARDEALAQLESWQTQQIQFVIDNGKLERDTFTETQRIIAKGKDDQYLLSLEYKQKDIDLNTQKGIELDAAEKTRKDNELKALTDHKSAMAKIEADYYVLIGQSFNTMKSLVLGGYDEILKKAQEALDAGKITALEFNNLVNDIMFKMTNLKNTFGPGNWNLPNIVPNVIPSIEPIRIPGFNEGTELVGGNPGIDKNLALLSYNEGVMKGELNTKRLDAGLNMAKTVEYAINYKNMLTDSSFVPLEFKPNLMQKLDERMAMQYLLNMNMQPVIEELQAVKMVIKNMPQTEFKITDGEISKVVRKGNSVQVFKSNMFD